MTDQKKEKEKTFRKWISLRQTIRQAEKRVYIFEDILQENFPEIKENVYLQVNGGHCEP